MVAKYDTTGSFCDENVLAGKHTISRFGKKLLHTTLSPEEREAANESVVPISVDDMGDENSCIDNDSVHPCSLYYRLERHQQLFDGSLVEKTCVQVYCGNCDYGPITLDFLEDGEKTRCMSCGVYMHDAEIASGNY